MSNLNKLYKYLKKSDKKILFLTTYNPNDRELSKYSKLSKELVESLEYVEVLNVYKLRIFECCGKSSTCQNKETKCWVTFFPFECSNDSSDEIEEILKSIYNADIILSVLIVKVKVKLFS